MVVGGTGVGIIAVVFIFAFGALLYFCRQHLIAKKEAGVHTKVGDVEMQKDSSVCLDFSCCSVKDAVNSSETTIHIDTDGGMEVQKRTISGISSSCMPTEGDNDTKLDIDIHKRTPIE